MASATHRHYRITCKATFDTHFRSIVVDLIIRYCLVGIGVMVLGVFYWAMWRVILPKVFGYELVPRKETLSDGTVVTLV